MERRNGKEIESSRTQQVKLRWETGSRIPDLGPIHPDTTPEIGNTGGQDGGVGGLTSLGQGQSKVLRTSRENCQQASGITIKKSLFLFPPQGNII